MESEEHDENEAGDDDDANDPNERKGKRARGKQKSYKKKVERQWTDDEILSLIKAIESQRALWDFSCPEYKLQKETVWEQVADTVSSTVNDCKAKWGNLRTTFNNNLTKYRAKKSGQGAEESYTVAWKFFTSMMFLEASKVSQSTQSTSSMELVTFLFAF